LVSFSPKNIRRSGITVFLYQDARIVVRNSFKPRHSYGQFYFIPTFERFEFAIKFTFSVGGQFFVYRQFRGILRGNTRFTNILGDLWPTRMAAVEGYGEITTNTPIGRTRERTGWTTGFLYNPDKAGKRLGEERLTDVWRT